MTKEFKWLIGIILATLFMITVSEIFSGYMVYQNYKILREHAIPMR